MVDDVSTPYVMIAATGKGPRGKTASLYQPGTHLILDLCPWAVVCGQRSRLPSRIKSRFPCEEILFLASCSSMRGYHDHIETVEAEYGRLLGCCSALYGCLVTEPQTSGSPHGRRYLGYRRLLKAASSFLRSLGP